MKLLRFPLLMWGGFMLFFACMILIFQTRFFVAQKHEGIWKDLQAYYLRLPSAKTEAEFEEQYGKEMVDLYIDNRPFIFLAFLPSDQAGVTAIISFAAVEIRSRRGITLSAGFLMFLTIVYAPIDYTLRRFHRLLTKRSCWSRSAAATCDDYFSQIDQRRFRSVLFALGLTLFASWVNALTLFSSRLQEIGVTMIDMTLGAMCIAYFGGLGLLLVTLIVDTIFLTVGKNPHLSLWDDGIAIAAVAPVLLFVYQNEILTIITNVIAGLAAGFYLKWTAARTL